jgi:enterochelin esterase family protein
MLILVMGTSIGVANAQRRAPSEPNYDAFYELGPDSLVRRGVPKGKVAGPFTLPSAAFPGVDHDYWVYVPAQYDGKTEVSLMVFNDGATYLQADGYYRAVNVLDNLIYRRELPLMIAAFIDPGKFRADGKSNRQPEYDPVTDRYSHVIVDELLPKLYADYRISREPDRHGIGGWSSGAIAAFTVAWERPDQFRKVLSGIGTYVESVRRARVSGEGHGERPQAAPDFHDRRTQRQPRHQRRRRVRCDARLVLSERPAQGRARREGVRRELRLGHGRPQPRHGRRDAAGDVRWLWRDHPVCRPARHPSNAPSASKAHRVAR